MNSDNQCGGNTCVTPGCPGCPACTTPRTCDDIRLEPKNLPVPICAPKNCHIFGIHDEYKPDNKCIPAKKRRIDNSLGSPIGLVKSSILLKTTDDKKMQAQRFAVYLKAFAKTYIMPESDWNTPAIDATLKEGQILYTESIKGGVEHNEAESSSIYSETELKVSRAFNVGDFVFNIELTEPDNKFTVNKIEEGENPENDLNISEFRSILKSFFHKCKYGLLKFRSWYLLVWKSRGVYFIFDFNGRNAVNFVSNRDNGFAMLLCLKSIDNISHLVTNLSNLAENSTFTLREVKVVKLVSPDGRVMTMDIGVRPNQYEVISSDYAFLKSALHLSLNRNAPLRNRSSFPTGIAVLLAGKIDHPGTWKEKILDKLICYGVNLFRYCWPQPLNTTDEIRFDQLPQEIKIGQFALKFSLTPKLWEGTWKCVPRYEKSELKTAIETSFKNSHNNLLLQINQQMYAIMKKNNYIYFFDPYRHRVIGSETPSEKYATLRMFRYMDTFLSVLTQILLESNRTSRFFIHKLEVSRIQQVVFTEGVPAVHPVECSTGDTISLNENICFDDDETECLPELAEISDYEDESLLSDTEEPKSETDESEEEPPMGEEEGGLDEFGGFDTSDGGGGGLRSRRGKRRGGRMRKGGRSRSRRTRSRGRKKRRGRSKSRKRRGKKSRSRSRKRKGKKRRGKKRKGKKRKGKKRKGKSKKKGKKKKGKKGKKKKGKKKGKKKKDKKKGKKKGKKKDKKKGKKKGKKDKKKKKKSDKDKKKKKQKKEKKPKKDKKSKKPKKEKKEKKKKEKKEKKKKEKKEKKQKPEKDKKKKPGDEKDDKKDKKDKKRKGDKSSDDDKSKGDDQFAKLGGEGDKKSGFGGDYRGDGEYDPREYGDITYNPNAYPGFSKTPKQMAVVGSENGSYESICKLLRAGFKCADRVLTMTPWGNYVVFRGYKMFDKIYFLFDGCTCNVNRFRHLNLACGTAGLLNFNNLHTVVCYIIDARKVPDCLKRGRKDIVQEICNEFCCK
ncbi:uncharacterized protein LOC119671868 [Teleopsis dalmanni]|uniref:uncharacterized protein LOC119671868 n=1 Tax=Teleopsis dalmanni TaxID=139649 RepID=UPI0018CDEE48|nr:uncharacterized protein LOC119671868 [Teleopsis dalmanni]